MKKLYIYMMLVSLLFAGSTLFTSCDDDVLDSIDLSGEWVGDMGVTITLGNWDYYAASTYMAFYPDYEYATHGYGEEIDYFDNRCPYHHQNYYFRWWIQDRILYLEYPGNHGLDIELPDYRFYYSKGRKTMSFTIHGDIYGLYKLSDYYYDDYNNYYTYDEYYSYNDWEWWSNGRIYDDGYYYDYTSWNYYGKQRDGVAADSTNQVEKNAKMESSENIEGYSVGRDFSKAKQMTVVE